MTKLLILTLAVFGGLAAGPAHAAITCPSASAIAARSSGVAPLFVFFDAIATDDSAMTGTNQEFRDLEYTWDFKDGGSGSWSTTGLSKSIATGPVTAHVYESSGSFQPTLTVQNAGGESCSVTLNAINVENGNTQFASSTRCVSASGNFSGCPISCPSADCVTTSDFDSALSAALSAGKKRILLRGGDSFAANQTVSLSTAGPGLLSSFGTGKPLISSSINNPLSISSAATDWRVAGLSLRGNGSTSSSNHGIASNGGTSQALLLRNDLSGFDYSIMMDLADLPNTQLGIVDNSITTGDNAYGIFAGFSGGAVLGNTVDGTLMNDPADGHPIRIGCIKKGVVSNNSSTGGYHDQLKLHASATRCANAESLFFVVSDNVFVNTQSAWSVNVAPQSDIHQERLRDAVVERNFLRFSGATHGYQGFMLNGERITARNNIVDLSRTQRSSVGIGVRNVGEINPTIHTEAYNNTCYRSDAGDPTCVRVNLIHGDVTNTSLKNNLLYAPSANLKVSASCAGSNCVSSNNLVATTNPFLISLPVVSADFQIASSSPAAGAGVSVPVLSDFGMRLRSPPPAVGAWDVSGATLGVPGRPFLVP